MPISYYTVEEIDQKLQQIALTPGPPGGNGPSAYEVAVANGFTGTEPEWLLSLEGADGDDGSVGASAYEIAIANGYSGTQAQWLASLKGTNGTNGASAYQVAVANGFAGTEAEWLASLKGDPGPVGPGGGLVGVVQLDSFSGATDDDKLTAALTYAAAQTRIPYIQFPARNVTLNQGGRIPFTGMKLIGPNAPGPKNLEISSGTPVNHRVTIGASVTTGTNSLFHSTGTLYDIYVGDLAFQGSHTAQFWSQPSGTLYACEFNALTFYGIKNVFGNPTQKALLTQVAFTGHWTVLGFQDQTFHMGGSDNNLWDAGYLNINSPSSGGAGKYCIRLDKMDKTVVGPIYNTAEGGWLGTRLTGNSEGLTIRGARFEGRGASNPCDGNTLRIEGGNVALRDPWLAYGMAAPTANSGDSQGIVHITGGNVVIDRPSYKRATAVGETVPMVYVGGGRVVIRDAAVMGWTGKPVVKVAAGASVTLDSSVTQV